MKRSVIFILIFLVLLSSCSDNLVFRGANFGDSLEEVLKLESGVPDKGDDLTGRDYLKYEDIEIGGNKGYLEYIFTDDKLEQILYSVPSYMEKADIKDTYDELLKEYEKYGEFIEDKATDNGKYVALLKNNNSGIVLIVAKEGYNVLFHEDYDKCKLFYEPFQ